MTQSRSLTAFTTLVLAASTAGAVPTRTSSPSSSPRPVSATAGNAVELASITIRSSRYGATHKFRFVDTGDLEDPAIVLEAYASPGGRDIFNPMRRPYSLLERFLALTDGMSGLPVPQALYQAYVADFGRPPAALQEILNLRGIGTGPLPPVEINLDVLYQHPIVGILGIYNPYPQEPKPPQAHYWYADQDCMCKEDNGSQGGDNVYYFADGGYYAWDEIGEPWYWYETPDYAFFHEMKLDYVAVQPPYQVEELMHAIYNCENSKSTMEIKRKNILGNWVLSHSTELDEVGRYWVWFDPPFKETRKIAFTQDPNSPNQNKTGVIQFTGYYDGAITNDNIVEEYDFLMFKAFDHRYNSDWLNTGKNVPDDPEYGHCAIFIHNEGDDD